MYRLSCSLHPRKHVWKQRAEHEFSLPGETISLALALSLSRARSLFQGGKPYPILNRFSRLAQEFSGRSKKRAGRTGSQSLPVFAARRSSVAPVAGPGSDRRLLKVFPSRLLTHHATIYPLARSLAGLGLTNAVCHAPLASAEPLSGSSLSFLQPKNKGRMTYPMKVLQVKHVAAAAYKVKIEAARIPEQHPPPPPPLLKLSASPEPKAQNMRAPVRAEPSAVSSRGGTD